MPTHLTTNENEMSNIIQTDNYNDIIDTLTMYPSIFTMINNNYNFDQFYQSDELDEEVNEIKEKRLKHQKMSIFS